MKRADLEHILRASKDLTGESEFVVIGSQAILGAHPDAPREFRESMEADLYPRDRPELAEAIEGSLGRYSQFEQFEQTFGYFAGGDSPSPATLPEGWAKRLIPSVMKIREGRPAGVRSRMTLLSANWPLVGTRI